MPVPQEILEAAYARSPQAQTEGVRDDAVTTTPAEINLTSYAGKIVKIRCFTNDIFWCCGPTGFTLSVDGGGDQAIGTAGVADRLRAGPEGDQFTVPEAPNCFIRYRSVDATANAGVAISPK
jgi:hypothetical protein